MMPLLLSLLLRLSAAAQAEWQPFQPGLIYSFSTAAAATPAPFIYLL
ncbi:hypothetical protein [Hymenobacter saemangeumensis]